MSMSYFLLIGCTHYRFFYVRHIAQVILWEADLRPEEALLKSASFDKMKKNVDEVTIFLVPGRTRVLHEATQIQNLIV